MRFLLALSEGIAIPGMLPDLRDDIADLDARFVVAIVIALIIWGLHANSKRRD